MPPESQPKKESDNASPFAGFVSESYLDGVLQEPAAGADTTAGGESTVAGDDTQPADSGEEAPAADAAGSAADAGDDEGAPAEDAAEEEAPVAKPVKKHVSPDKRIAQYRRVAGDAERRAVAAERRVAELEAGGKPTEKEGLTPAAAAAKKTEEAAPTPDKYEYGELDSRYIADVVKFETAKALKAARAEEETTRQTEAAALQRAEYLEKAGAVRTAGLAKYEDFDETVLQSDIINTDLTQTVHDLLLESEAAPDIAYHLATHPEEARAIFSKAPMAQAAHFGRLEARFLAEAKPAPKKAPIVPKASPPPRIPRGGGGQFSTPASTTDFAAFEAKAMGPTKG